MAGRLGVGLYDGVTEFNVPLAAFSHVARWRDARQFGWNAVVWQFTPHLGRVIARGKLRVTPGRERVRRSRRLLTRSIVEFGAIRVGRRYTKSCYCTVGGDGVCGWYAGRQH